MPQDVSFGFRFRRPTPIVGATLALLVAVFVVMALLVRFTSWGHPLYQSLSLDPSEVLRGRKLWGVLTAALLHSLEDTDHLLFNGLAFYFFGPDLEELWGRGRFVLFMVLSALGASAFVLAAAALGISSAPVVGFSGVVLGVLTAWGLTYPDREMFFFLFRLKGLHMVYVTLAMQVLTALSFSRVSAAAHFGGMAVGAAWTMTTSGPLRRWWLRRRLSRLQAESEALREAPAARRRAGGPALRVIQGGAEGKPKDKRYLN